MSPPVLSVADRVRSLLGEYCWRIDLGDFDGVGALFADGRLADEDGGVLASGRAEVAAFYRSSTRLHEGSPRTKHLVNGTVLSTEGDLVVARSSYLVLQSRAPAPPEGTAATIEPIIAGRYLDTFSAPEDGDEVRWVERRFLIDLVGDLSRHLTFGLA